MSPDPSRGRGGGDIIIIKIIFCVDVVLIYSLALLTLSPLILFSIIMRSIGSVITL